MVTLVKGVRYRTSLLIQVIVGDRQELFRPHIYFIGQKGQPKRRIV